jgi:hypothetical protein
MSTKINVRSPYYVKVSNAEFELCHFKAICVDRNNIRHEYFKIHPNQVRGGNKQLCGV